MQTQPLPPDFTTTLPQQQQQQRGPRAASRWRDEEEGLYYPEATLVPKAVVTNPFSEYLKKRPRHPTQYLEVLRSEVDRGKQELFDRSRDDEDFLAGLLSELSIQKSSEPFACASTDLDLIGTTVEDLDLRQHSANDLDPSDNVSDVGSLHQRSVNLGLHEKDTVDLARSRKISVVAEASSSEALNGPHFGLSRTMSKSKWGSTLNSTFEMSGNLSSLAAAGLSQTQSRTLTREGSASLLTGWNWHPRSFNSKVGHDQKRCYRLTSDFGGGNYVIGNGRVPFYAGRHIVVKGYYYAIRIDAVEGEIPEVFDEAPATPASHASSSSFNSGTPAEEVSPTGSVAAEEEAARAEAERVATAATGLAIGVSPVAPNAAEMLCSQRPLQGYEVPGSVLVGYGPHYVTGNRWSPSSSWKSSRLRAGDEVGVLISSKGDFVIYVNGNQVFRTKDKSLTASTVATKRSFYPLVDLCGSVSAVSMLTLANPPSKPLE